MWGQTTPHSALQDRAATSTPPQHPCLHRGDVAQQQRSPARRGACVQTRAAATLEAGSRPRVQVDIAKLGPDPWNDTYYPKGIDVDPVKKPWYVIDASGANLGRMATLIAMHLRGKTVPTYTPSMDTGGYVVVLNAEKVTVTGSKASDKLYRRHTGRPGGLKSETFRDLQARIPERIVEKAVKGMLPSGRLGRHLFTHLKVYKGGKHPHSAQVPTDITHLIAGNMHGQKAGQASAAQS